MSTSIDFPSIVVNGAFVVCASANGENHEAVRNNVLTSASIVSTVTSPGCSGSLIRPSVASATNALITSTASSGLARKSSSFTTGP